MFLSTKVLKLQVSRFGTRKGLPEPGNKVADTIDFLRVVKDDKYNLGFPLLADADNKVAMAYGAGAKSLCTV